MMRRTAIRTDPGSTPSKSTSVPSMSSATSFGRQREPTA